MYFLRLTKPVPQTLCHGMQQDWKVVRSFGWLGAIIEDCCFVNDGDWLSQISTEITL